MRSGSGVSWTEVYTLQSVSPAQVTVRSYGTSSVSASYSGPLPGTLCYDGNCSQVRPGAYTAPGDSILRTWTVSEPEDCPPGYIGTRVFTEYWRTVRYWTPSVVGVSSRGTGRFTSATRDEMYDRALTQSTCTPSNPPEPTSSTSSSSSTSSTLTSPTSSTSSTSYTPGSQVNIDMGVSGPGGISGPIGPGALTRWKGQIEKLPEMLYRLPESVGTKGFF